jgi:imidazolonepropionase-like amidohydrolase
MAYGVRADWLWTGTDAAPIRDGLVVVDEDRIAAVGSASALSIPSDLHVIDRGTEFLMPGLIDAHTHISIIPGLGDQIGQLRQPVEQQAIRGVGNLRTMLESGVTTARIMGEEHLLDVTFKTAIGAGTVPGPNLVIATRPITQTNGHGRALSSADGVDEVRKTCRQNLYDGADFLKLFITGGVSSTRGGGIRAASYSREEIRIAVEEAERNGTYVAAHAIGGPGIRLGVEEGVRTIEHATLAMDEDLEAIQARGAWVVLTQAIMLHPTGIERGDRHNPAIMEKLAYAREMAEDRLRAIVPSGVSFAVGTDSMHGLVAFEIERVVELGGSPLTALLAATSRAAACCQLDDRTGTLEAGKQADILTVSGNPFDDIKAMYEPRFIIKGGQPITGMPA